jgi:sRNA-binding regulator protein Hfq
MSCGYGDIVEWIINKGKNVNTKGDNRKIPFAFSMWKQLRWNCFNTMHGVQFPIYLFIDAKIINGINLCDLLQLYKHYVGVICTKGKREQMWKHIMSLVTSNKNVFQTQNKNEG